MKKKLNRIASGLLVLVMLITLVLSFRPAAAKVGEWTGIAGETLVFWSRTIFITALGLYLVNLGVAGLVVPWIGISLIVIGLALVAYSWWPFFSSKGATE